MRIAVCESVRQEAEQMVHWIEEYCALYQFPVSLQTFPDPQSFHDRQERFDLVYICFGGSTGFLQASRLRERDKSLPIVLVDDTREYALACVRIHCADFILRPVTFAQIARSMALALGRDAP